MNRRPLEPLDAEEAALAEQLARLGPHGEPSPRLDARILAAAHDAVTEPLRPRHRSRWPLGLGVAASALLAVGIAWQLRPVDHSPLDREFAAADASASAAADTGAAAQTGAAEEAGRTVIPPPAPLLSRSAEVARDDTLPANAAPSAIYNPPAVTSAPEPAAAQPKVAAAKRAPSPAQPRRVAEVPAMNSGDSLDSIVVDTTPQYRNPAAASLPPPPPPPPASVASADRPTRVLGGVVADPETYAEIAAQRELARAEHARNAAVSAERAERSEVRARRASEASADMQNAIQQAPAAAPPASTDNYATEFGRSTGGVATVRSGNTSVPLLSPGVTRNSLKRTDLQLPVIEDSKLDADDWLERIRLRRDLGDRASAVESLLRFRQAHPFQKTPEDLQELLAE